MQWSSHSKWVVGIDGVQDLREHCEPVHVKRLEDWEYLCYGWELNYVPSGCRISFALKFHGQRCEGQILGIREGQLQGLGYWRTPWKERWADPFPKACYRLNRKTKNQLHQKREFRTNGQRIIEREFATESRWIGTRWRSCYCTAYSQNRHSIQPQESPQEIATSPWAQWNLVRWLWKRWLER